MKIIRNDVKFEPITIVLETMEEAEVIKTICGEIGGISNGRAICSSIYKILDNFEIKDLPIKGVLEFRE